MCRGCPKPGKFCLCVTAAARLLCVPWATKTAAVAQQVVQRRQNHRHGGSRVAVVAEWRHSGRHSYRSMDPSGRPKEAQWWHKGGRSIAQIDNATQCLQQYVPLCIHCATTAMRTFLQMNDIFCGIAHASAIFNATEWKSRLCVWTKCPRFIKVSITSHAFDDSHYRRKIIFQTIFFGAKILS